MDRIIKSYRDRYCGWSLRTAVIAIGILEAIVIPIHLMVTVTNNHIVNDFVQLPEICFIGTGIIIGLIIAAALIFGAVKQNRYFLWFCNGFIFISMVMTAVLFTGIDTKDRKNGNERTPMKIAFAIQGIVMFMVYRYICELRDTENKEPQYDNVAAPEKMDNATPLTA